jgi:hypothetical protein
LKRAPLAADRKGVKQTNRENRFVGWGFENYEALTEASTNLFVHIDSTSAEGVRPHTLRDDYDAAADLALPSHVPQSVRDYFDGTRMLWLHGWFYYPFYSMAGVHSYLCMELAFKERLRIDSIVLPRRQRTFKGMLQHAINEKWFSPKGFGTIRRRIERENYYANIEAGAFEEPVPDSIDREALLYADMVRLLKYIPSFRNQSAHPDGLTLLLPGMIYTQLEFTRDAIAQLFAARMKAV